MGVSGISSVGQGNAAYSAPEPAALRPVVESEPAPVAKPAEYVAPKAIIAEGMDDSNEEEDAKKYVEAFAKLNKQVSGASLSFAYHEKTHRVMFKLVDDVTKEVIREVPAEKVLNAVASMWEAAGILVDEKR